MPPPLPDDVLRYLMAFVPRAWLTIDLRLALGIPPGKLDAVTIDPRRPAVILNRDGERTVVLYASNDETKEWKTILVVCDRCVTLPFYYPKYELL